MLAIKLKRIGKKGQASFRVIVAEKRSKVDGRFVEDMGWFNPHNDKFKLDIERINYWIKNGAQPTPSIKNLLKKKV
ncbi:MAG: 30S ribosomal protein S16 [Patescibacteria group bacterium]